MITKKFHQYYYHSRTRRQRYLLRRARWHLVGVAIGLLIFSFAIDNSSAEFFGWAFVIITLLTILSTIPLQYVTATAAGPGTRLLTDARRSLLWECYKFALLSFVVSVLFMWVIR